MTPTLTIRFAMLLGVLLFGAVVFVTRLSPDAPTLTPDKLRSLRLIGQVLWVVAVGGAAFALYRYQGTDSRGQRQTIAIIGWALGEMVAIFGAVVWYLSGSPTWYIPGLLYFLITLLVFRARKD